MKLFFGLLCVCAVLSGCGDGHTWTNKLAIVNEVRVLVEREPSKAPGDTPGSAIAVGSVGYVIAGPVGAAFGAIAGSEGPVPNGHSAKVTACSLALIIEGNIWYLRPNLLSEGETRECALLKKGDTMSVAVKQDKGGQPLQITWKSNSLSTTR